MRKSVVRERVSAGRVAGDTAAGIIDELAAQLKVLGRAQARHAALMVEFTDTRRALDQRGIDDDRHLGGRPSLKAGEFASTEISMAVKASKFTVQRTVSMTRRVKTEAPDAWDAWVAGDIDQDKIIRINRALRRLVQESSKELLNSVVVDLAVCRTPEILGRCLNQFIVRVEPDLQDERLHRSFADRYVSVRPDLDGITFRSPRCPPSTRTPSTRSCAHSRPSPTRRPPHPATTPRRRPGRPAPGPARNGCHPTWDTNSDTDDHLDDTAQPPDHDRDDDSLDSESPDTDSTGNDTGVADGRLDKSGAAGSNAAGSNARGGDLAGTEVDDWDLPASATARPTQLPGRHHRTPRRCTPVDHLHRHRPAAAGAGHHRCRRVRAVPDRRHRHPRTTDGPQRSGPPATIRALAQQPGTLFYRLLTDPQGNLLDVTELGRFPSGKLGTAIKFRDGVCANPTCTVPHTAAISIISSPCPTDPPPQRTSAPNADTNTAPKHTPDTTANAPAHTPTQWTTPTGHTYTSTDEPLPVENWPDPPLRQ